MRRLRRVVEADGKKNPVEQIKPTLEQLAFISYTSGTTSDPKGALGPHFYTLALSD